MRQDKLKLSRKRLISYIIILVAIACIAVLAIVFGFFQRQEVLEKYQLAYMQDGKSLEISPINITDIAVDKRGQDKDLYFRINSNYDLDYLFRLAYRQFEVKKSTDSKLYDGTVDFSVSDNAYVIQESLKKMDKDIYAVFSLHNKKGNEIYRYDPEETSTDKYIERIKPTVLQGYEKSELGNYDDFINITKLFHDKLNKKVTVTVDKEKKMIEFKIRDEK